MKPLMKPIKAAHQQHDENPDGGRPLQAEAEIGGGHDNHGADRRREAVDRLERQIELAGDDDQRFASTTSASAADEVRMVVDVAGVRKTGLTNAPMMTRTTSAGSSARSREARA